MRWTDKTVVCVYNNKLVIHFIYELRLNGPCVCAAAVCFCQTTDDVRAAELHFFNQHEIHPFSHNTEQSEHTHYYTRRLDSTPLRFWKSEILFSFFLSFLRVFFVFCCCCCYFLPHWCQVATHFTDTPFPETHTHTQSRERLFFFLTADGQWQQQQPFAIGVSGQRREYELVMINSTRRHLHSLLLSPRTHAHIESGSISHAFLLSFFLFLLWAEKICLLFDSKLFIICNGDGAESGGKRIRPVSCCMAHLCRVDAFN